MFYFGIDWSEDHHNLRILNEAGARVSRLKCDWLCSVSCAYRRIISGCRVLTKHVRLRAAVCKSAADCPGEPFGLTHFNIPCRTCSISWRLQSVDPSLPTVFASQPWSTRDLLLCRAG